MEKVDTQTDDVRRNQELEPASTKASTKADLELEAQSIASALDGDFGAESLNEPELPEDLEKATTQASRTTHEPATRITTAVDWSGPDDPGNSQNWSLLRRSYQTLAIGALSFAVTCGSSVISPATLQIADDLSVSRTAAILSLTVYVLGLATGPMIAAPISETYGRNMVYKLEAPLFMLFLVGAGFSKSLGSLLICRLLAGMAGGPVLAVGAGTSADMYVMKVM